MKYLLPLCLLLIPFIVKSQTEFSVPIVVTAVPDSGKVKFTWPQEPAASAIRVYRKPANIPGWGLEIATLAGSATAFSDTITTGKRYEYFFRVSRSSPSLSYSYLTVGIEAEPIHYKGKVLLLVDSTMAMPLDTVIQRLKLDLICEGWMVSQLNVSPNAQVTDVKQAVVDYYNQDITSHHAVFILGHVPVPYAGEINPDGHSDHLGAWPADVYYSNNGNAWTDVTVNLTSASRQQNWNTPGDGKFDQYILTGRPKLAVGRADFNNMPVFQLSDTLLLKRYLDKDHNYRTKAFTARPRMLIDDNFGYFNSEAFAQNGWRAGRALFGNDSIVQGDFIQDAKTSSYLWAYACGGGSYISAGGVGYTSDMVADSMKSVFTMMFGSYFGDWDTQNNFLRAPLAAKGYALTNCWAGRPHWFFHTMGMGSPISYSIINSQYNSEYGPGGYGATFTHSGFMGDPTLTLNPIYQPAALTITENMLNGNAELQWTASPDADVLGYYVYRAKSVTDSFVCITPQYVTVASYIDVAPDTGNTVYMVRTVKLENTFTGSYYNVGIGIVDSVEILLIPDGIAENTLPDFSVYPNPSNGLYTIKMNSYGAYTIEVFTPTGSLAMQQKATGNTMALNIQTLDSGVYMLKISTGKGIAEYKKLLKISGE